MELMYNKIISNINWGIKMKRKNIIIILITLVIISIAGAFIYISYSNNKSLSEFSDYIKEYKTDMGKYILTGHEEEYNSLIKQSEKVIKDKKPKNINDTMVNLNVFKDKLTNENTEIIDKNISEIQAIDITMLENKDFVTAKIDEIKKLINNKEFIKAKNLYALLKDDIHKKIETRKGEEEKKKAEEEANKIKNLLNKEKYMNKLNDIQIGIQRDLSKKYGGSMMDMKEASYEEYQRWDGALNEIYKALKAGLKPDLMDNLKNQQLKWIKYRDDTAKKDSLQFQGGSMEGLEYSASLAKLTKDRCYELVKEYMK